MLLSASVRHALTAAAVTTALFASAAPGFAAERQPTVQTGQTGQTGQAAQAGQAGHTGKSGPYAQLHPLASLSAERLATADLVAAAKWGTGSPIDDPAREQVVLDTVRKQAVETGADPEATVRVFRDQIEANKLVQRELHRLWTADPSKAPAERPDLAEVRKEINRVNTALVQAIAGSATARSASYCRGVLALSALQVRHEKQLDRLHFKALARAVPSVCAEQD
ncbi:chorismate mutase [Streptomyces jumonjinensis]|uniref:chorismate mutase n=1 Tax=Streptomyces jumonjinensis TaxID=1945 RepID=A0A646KQK1_STRJU|nr:chorismate mutase [Streptomyces jumonjinensis]MQT04327.1 chorismate mutase [Streptomyces jumonjinensis]